MEIQGRSTASSEMWSTFYSSTLGALSWKMHLWIFVGRLETITLLSSRWGRINLCFKNGLVTISWFTGKMFWINWSPWDGQIYSRQTMKSMKWSQICTWLKGTLRTFKTLSQCTNGRHYAKPSYVYGTTLPAVLQSSSSIQWRCQGLSVVCLLYDPRTFQVLCVCLQANQNRNFQHPPLQSEAKHVS